MLPVERINFEEAISEPKLLQRAWVKLSPPQQSALRVFYGLPLDEEGLKHYSIFTADPRVNYDKLGFPTNVPIATDYDPVEHDEAVLIFGRRSAKTSGFLAFVMAYEALLGGHTAWRGSEKQQIASFVVAQKLEIAQAIIRDFVEPIISSSKLLEKEIVGFNAFGMELKNGHLIKPAPPVIKNFRYFAIPVVAMDECAFWYKDATSANPDFEVVRAVSPAQGQFPNRKMIAASTVWTKEGIIWQAKTAGMYGRNLPADDEDKERYRHTMVLTAPTPAMQNPLMLDRKWFEKELRKDPEAYNREILNIAINAVSGMFTDAAIEEASKNAPTVRPPLPDIFYVGAMDPAFRGDDFTFTIGHYEKELGFIQDLLMKWSPLKGSKLNPSVILDEIKQAARPYGVDTFYSDQYQLESLQQLALDRDLSIIGMDFTANSKSKLFGSFQQLMRNKRAHLLRNKEQKTQFTQIQKIVGHGGYIRISAPVGKHDDIVTVTVLCAAMAIRFENVAKTDDDNADKPKTLYERVMKQLQSKAAEANPNDEFL